MSGHVNLGNNRNAPVRRIADDLFHLFLRVEALLFRPLPYKSSYTGQERIAFYFDAPAKSFGQMPMKVIHLQHRSHVDIFLDRRHFLILASGIQHKAAPFHPWKIGDLDTRKYQSSFLTRVPLPQTLNGIDKAGIIRCPDNYSLRRHTDAITFCRQSNILFPGDVAVYLLSAPFHSAFGHQFFIKQTYERAGRLLCVHSYFTLKP